MRRGDDVFLVGDVVVQRLLQGEHAGHAVDERQHDDAEAHLQLRVLIQLVEHHLRDGVLLQLDDDIDAVAVGTVVDVRRSREASSREPARRASRADAGGSPGRGSP